MRVPVAIDRHSSYPRTSSPWCGCLLRCIVRFWPITSFRIAHQLRRFGCEADKGSSGSRDLILDTS
jgi:hypothetical protein